MSKKIMIVDDSRFIYEELKVMLSHTDYEIAGFFQNGESAVAAYDKLRPDLAVIDIVLPGIDGLDAAALIKDKDPHARILILSSLAYDEVEKDAANIGVNGFLYKPFSSSELLSAMDRAFK